MAKIRWPPATTAWFVAAARSGSGIIGRIGPARMGILLGALAYGLFGIHDASIKYLVERLPVWQVLFFRSITITIVCVALGRTSLLARARVSTMKQALLGRAALTLAAWMLYFTASRRLPLAQMTALYYIAPVMVTLMAAPLLGERVTRLRWISVAVGFAGVLLASDPGGLSASLPALMVLMAAAFWGYGVILMRRIARRESSLMQMMFINVFVSIATGVACVVTWQPMQMDQVALLGVVVVFGGLAQFAMFEAVKLAPASVMATVEYTGLIWAVVLGFLIWGDLPALPVALGALLILAAGTMLVIGERRRPKP